MKQRERYPGERNRFYRWADIHWSVIASSGAIALATAIIFFVVAMVLGTIGEMP